MPDVKKNFKLLRLSSNHKTIEDASKILNISKSMLYKIEQGHKQPGRELIKKMGEAYGCSVEDIFFAIDVTLRDKNISA